MFLFYSLKGVGERLSEEEVESGASATQTPEVYQTNLSKQPGKLRENRSGDCQFGPDIKTIELSRKLHFTFHKNTREIP